MDYSFKVDLKKDLNVSTSESPIIDVTLNKDKPIVVDCNANNWYIDTDLTDENLINIGLANFVSLGSGGTGSMNSVFIIKQEDITDLDTALATLNKDSYSEGDFLIITDASAENTTGYVFSLEYGWLAFGGNADASNVLFSNDILCAGNYTQVGNVNKTISGTTTIPAKGKTIEEIMTSIFTQELQPTKTEPAVSISFPQAGSKEVGTTVTPTYSASLSAGGYTYGPATAVVASGWTVSDTDGNSATAASGSFPSFVVGDSTNYKITATATHNAGVVAVTNLGKASVPPVQIAAGTKTKTSSAVTGYRSLFYGALNTDSSVPLTSAIVRGLTNGGAYNGSKNLVINPITGGKRYIVAVPASNTRSGLTSVILPNSLNAQVVTQYTTQTISVEGKDGYTAVDYKVYVYEPASIGVNEIHNIILG